jgi:hypothetical protein
MASLRTACMAMGFCDVVLSSAHGRCGADARDIRAALAEQVSAAAVAAASRLSSVALASWPLSRPERKWRRGNNVLAPAGEFFGDVHACAWDAGDIAAACLVGWTVG